MKSFRLELTEQEAEQLTELATAHGNKFKPFAEYLLRLQLGAVPPPTVKPVKIPTQEEEPQKVTPKKVKPLKKKQPKKDKPQENDPIKERFGMFVYNDTFYDTREEAEAAIK